VVRDFGGTGRAPDATRGKLTPVLRDPCHGPRRRRAKENGASTGPVALGAGRLFDQTLGRSVTSHCRFEAGEARLWGRTPRRPLADLIRP
jgi:hypothetical protein